MTDLLRERLAGIRPICARHRVRSPALFGSAAGGRLDPSRGDLDLRVEFRPMPPAEYAESYFGLTEDLEKLFGVRVDLVEAAPIRNPYFRETTEATKETLYVAG